MRLVRVTVDLLLPSHFDDCEDLGDVHVESVKVTGYSDEDLTNVIDQNVQAAALVMVDD